LSALGARLLYWQDKHIEIVAGKASLSGVFNRYRKEARRMLEEGRLLYPLERPVSGDARLLAHPPGYSILLAGIYKIGVDEYKGLWLVQIVCDAAAALLIFLIALELLNWWVALPAAMMVALSPHLAYYSLLLSPDSLSVLPILAAVYLMAKSFRRPSVIRMILAGALIGVSCWLTANSMLLGLLLGLVAFLQLEKGKRLRLAMALVGSTMTVIAPITIRNLVVFDRFIPLSIQAGLSLVEGIGDYDKQGTLGMPRSDREARAKDAEWNGRPDYGPSLWSPDGIDRDRTRLDRGLAVVRSNPGWFLGVMARRAEFMVSYNESRSREWPSNTASAPPIYSEAGYGHPIENTDNQNSGQPGPSPVLVLNGTVVSGPTVVTNGQPETSNTPTDLNTSGTVFSPPTRVSLVRNGEALEVVGDNSEYGAQFASAPIAVRKNTDYVLVAPVSLLNGGMALKVMSSDLGNALAIADIAQATQETSGKTVTSGGTSVPQMTPIQLPFATGNRSEVRIVLCNDGTSALPPAALLGPAQIFETGPTPYLWTGYVRKIVRSVQRQFTTGITLALIIVGIVLLLLARRGPTLVILLAVPFYYLSLQSPLHTEYRYILSIHYFLFVMAGVTLGCFMTAIVQASRAIAWRRKTVLE